MKNKKNKKALLNDDIGSRIMLESFFSAGMDSEKRKQAFNSMMISKDPSSESNLPKKPVIRIFSDRYDRFQAPEVYEFFEEEEE